MVDLLAASLFHDEETQCIAESMVLLFDLKGTRCNTGSW